MFSQISGIIALCNVVISRLWWQLVWFICVMSPRAVPRYFFPDIGFRRNNGVRTVWPIPEGGSQITHGGFWGTFVRLHRTSDKTCFAQQVRNRPTAECDALVTCDWFSIDVVGESLINRKRSPSTHSSIRWCQTRPLSVWCGFHSCIGWPTWRTVRRQHGIFINGEGGGGGKLARPGGCRGQLCIIILSHHMHKTRTHTHPVKTSYRDLTPCAWVFVMHSSSQDETLWHLYTSSVFFRWFVRVC